MEVLSSILKSNLTASPMRQFYVWVVDVRSASRRFTSMSIGQADDMFLHTRVDCTRGVGKIKCLGSGALMFFDPRPHEHQRFKVPDALLEK
jgi:hypothetical protein